MTTKALVVSPRDIRPVSSPMPVELRLRRSEMRAAQKIQQAEILRQIILNPVLEIVVGFALTEFLQSWEYNPQRPGDRLMGQNVGTVAEAGIVTAVCIQQLGPNIKPVLQGAATAGQEITDAIMAIPKIAGTFK